MGACRSKRIFYPFFSQSKWPRLYVDVCQMINQGRMRKEHNGDADKIQHQYLTGYLRHNSLMPHPHSRSDLLRT